MRCSIHYAFEKSKTNKMVIQTIKSERITQ